MGRGEAVSGNKRECVQFGAAAFSRQRISFKILQECVTVCTINYISESEDESEKMASTTFTLRVGTDVKKRLEKLAKSTGRSRSFLAAEALSEYLDVNEWQVAGVRKALGSLDRGEGVPNEQVKAWVNSWGGKRERPVPKRSAT
jgi:RHH-type rel operon transcriptional repressor/antitoxin RelB